MRARNCPRSRRLITLIAVLAVGSAAAAEETKKAPGETNPPPKEISIDLGKSVKLEMVLVPAGEFMMGSPDSDDDSMQNEKPQHRVRITKPFYLGKYPVTQEQWEAVMGKNPSEFKGPKHPVENVSWADCQEFLKKLNARVTGPTFRLPTEAQWEYACRAGSKTRYYFGDDEEKLGEYAWYQKNSDGHTHPVGMKKANAWGLHDMHGNVAEVCGDSYDVRYYAKSPTDNPAASSAGRRPPIRGGTPISLGSWCRSAERDGMNDIRGHFLGLRTARDE
jgi:formylglycine-generating enzyme required for sulfatase activity